MTATKEAISWQKQARNSMLAKVHIAKKQLAMDEDTYRAMLQTSFGVRSSSKLTNKGLADLIEHLKAQGFKAKKSPPKRAGTDKLATSDFALKPRALWISLYHLGVVKDPSEAALGAFVKRVTGGKETGLDSLEWLKEESAFKVIEALKAWAARDANVDWSNFSLGFQQGMVSRPRKRVIQAQIKLLAGNIDMSLVLEALAPIGGQYLNQKMDYEDALLDQVIENLGKLVREIKS